MMKVILDYYPHEQAFALHLEGGWTAPGVVVDRLDAQAEWIAAERIAKRIAKHLRRVGLQDRGALAWSLRAKPKPLDKR